MSGRCTATALYTAAAKVNLRTHKVFYLDTQGQVRRIRNAKAAPTAPTGALVLPVSCPNPTPATFRAHDRPAGAFATTVSRATASGRKGRARARRDTGQLLRAGRYAEVAALLSTGRRPVSVHEVRLALNPAVTVPEHRADRLAPVLVSVPDQIGCDIGYRCTDPELLWAVAKTRPRAVAGNEHCPAELFDYMFDNLLDDGVIENMAGNPALPARLATQILHGDRLDIDEDELDYLAELMVANTRSQEIFDELADKYVPHAAVNPLATPAWLRSKYDELLARYPADGPAPMPGLAELACNGDPDLAATACRYAYQHWKSVGAMEPLRQVVAQAASIPFLEQLIEDDPDTLFAVVCSTKVPTSDDLEIPDVRDLVARFPSAPTTFAMQLPCHLFTQLFALSSTTKPLDEYRRCCLASQTTLPEALGDLLAEDYNPSVRHALIHAKTPDRLLARLEADPDPHVAHTAAAERAYRIRLQQPHPARPEQGSGRFDLFLRAAEAGALTAAEADVFHALVADWQGDPSELVAVARAVAA